MLDNFFLIINGVACQEDDSDSTDCFATFTTDRKNNSMTTSELGKTYGSDIISIADLLNRVEQPLSADNLIT